jgi:sugar/nucleoside kinase (ribokinase family)
MQDRDSSHLGVAPDVIGFGALNVDYIASASRLSQFMDDRITESTARFELNREGPVDQQTIIDAIRNLGSSSLSCSLGGSAWLTIFTLAQMKVGIRLGYVGVLGRIETPGLSFIDQMDTLGIDHRWVGRRVEKLCGVCVSYINDTDRVMLIHPGANVEMYGYLQDNFDAVGAYLASARFVHVTSFLDDLTPGQVASVLERAKEINRHLRISFDPGFDWAQHPSDDVCRILAVTDMLFANYREFKALGGYTHGESDGAIARKVLRRCAEGCVVFVTKRYDFTETFQRTDSGIAMQRFLLRKPLREAELEDATGAGDVFSAAVLSALTSSRLHIELGAFLGLSLARYKIRQPFDSVFPDLGQGFLQQTNTEVDARVSAPGVFLVHDESPYFEEVSNFIANDCNLPLFDINVANVGGDDIMDAVGDGMAYCSFAICLLSMNEEMSNGRMRADQNIVYQAGVFQGRYGFGRVALLAEEGCDTFSNIAGLMRLDFPASNIDSSFIELRRMLRREGLLSDV